MTVSTKDTTTAQEKMDSLQGVLQGMGSLVVAYSGGVDSAFLAAVAHLVLGDRMLAVTANSPALAASELAGAQELAARLGFAHLVIDTNEINDPRYAANDGRRCYFCKTELYTRLVPLATERGFAWVGNGTNTDDLGDYRPGLDAADEYRVRSPLVEVGLSKAEIRELSQGMGLPTWDKPAMPCLSSRVAYGIPVTVETLSRVERAEQYLRELGIRQLRVRHHGSICRIEVEPKDMHLVLQAGSELVDRIKDLGYRWVSLDLEGFASGGLNRALHGDEAEPIATVT